MKQSDCNPYITEGKVAILIDGGFFLRRLHYLTENPSDWSADYVVQKLLCLCKRHAWRLKQKIYRIFYYDCPPFDKGLHNPLTGKFIKFEKSPQYLFKSELLARLKNKRKMAIRLGKLNLNPVCSWQIAPQKIKELLSGQITAQELNPDWDIMPALQQKQVDMKIGVDITTMVLKKQVSSIVLIAGDGDFVPASKIARREGVDFILDPMQAHINPDLNEHVDGVNSVLFLPKKKLDDQNI